MKIARQQSDLKLNSKCRAAVPIFRMAKIYFGSYFCIQDAFKVDFFRYIFLLIAKLSKESV